MNILIVVATDKEIDIKSFKNYKILTTGIGIANTVYALTKELMQNSYDTILNIGIAGSLNSELKIGDSVEVISDTFADLGSEDGDNFLTPNEMNLKTEIKFYSKKATQLRSVNAITVNTAHGNKASIQNIKKRLNPDIETMEGAAVMMVSKRFKTPCVQIRSISNKVEQRNKANWNISLAVSNLHQEIQNYINSL